MHPLHRYRESVFPQRIDAEDPLARLRHDQLNIQDGVQREHPIAKLMSVLLL
jgi:hypothetical protein